MVCLSCAAFDVNLGCSQFVYGLGIANAWIKSGMAARACAGRRHAHAFSIPKTMS
ncbi:MAG: hypothetical protein ACLUKN_14475 [Bacilli bacterium]